MAGLADLALGTAPIAGGFLLAMVTGSRQDQISLSGQSHLA